MFKINTAVLRPIGIRFPAYMFKQNFGKGVFEYYQSARMQEAARLLKEKRLTVSGVGCQVGFTNLSHFSRVFAPYIGMKPKKYLST